METDVLVVGAGPTGLMLAEELSRFGVRCRVIDAGRGPTDLSKAIGVQARTLETLDIIGVADQLVQRGNPAKTFRIYDGKDQILKLDFTRLDSRFPFLLTVPQSETEQVLLQKLNARQTVERETTLTGFTQDANGVDADLRLANGAAEKVRARWLVGCDGAHSRVREQLGLPFEGKDYEEGFLLADVHMEWSLPADELYLFLHDGWLAAFFALPGGRCRLIADLPPEQAPKDQKPTLEVCQQLVAERVPIPATLRDPNWTAYYRIHRRIVPRLQEGRVFLAGDAAHIHSPAAAQGMNTGIQDVFNLAWKLALVAGGQTNDDLLASYNAERYPVESAVLKDTDLLLQMASLRQPVARKLRDLLLPHLSATRLFQSQVGTIIGELSIDYRDSPLTLDRDDDSGPHAGLRAPDGMLTRENGEPVRLYELLREGQFLLLIFYAGETQDARPSALGGERIATALGPLQPLCRVCLIADANEITEHVPDDWLLLRDTSGNVSERYGATHPCIRLIRPDGYIGLRANAENLEAGLADFAHSLCLVEAGAARR